ncbi:matrixin family metalloprotease [Flavobacterium sp. W22_SRS_FP1]|uniref:matrixin family metalloprotease n=1 Tax=Flavobacterium sp. W22_SRS_FP1 TaxID=3240276 RepID=UPI003F912895
MKKISFIVVLLFLTFSFVNAKPKTIYIQPLGDVKQEYLDYIKTSVKKFYGYDCVIKSKLNLITDVLAGSGTRYEAGKILKKYNSKENVLLITEKDITHRKSNDIPEWGVFGLGFRPGKTCVISTFRLKKNVSKAKFLERLNKVALHEIGHNLGLDHCTNDKECMMTSASGTIKQVDREKIWFCSKCWNQIR